MGASPGCPQGWPRQQPPMGHAARFKPQHRLPPGSVGIPPVLVLPRLWADQGRPKPSEPRHSTCETTRLSLLDRLQRTPYEPFLFQKDAPAPPTRGGRANAYSERGRPSLAERQLRLRHSG